MAVVQYTFTQKKYIEHNRHKQYTEQHNSLIRKSADRAPSLRGIPWNLRYKRGKSTENPQLQEYGFVTDLMKGRVVLESLY